MPSAPARTISNPQVKKIINNLNNNAKLKENLRTLLQSSRASLCASDSQIQMAFRDAFHGLGRVINQDGRTFWISAELQTEINSLISQCIKAIGVQFGHEHDIERAIWKAISLHSKDVDGPSMDFYNSFKTNLLDPSKSRRSVLLSNRSLFLTEEVDELTIGPVKALSGNKAIDYLKAHNVSKNWNIDVGQLGFGSSFSTSNGNIHFGIPEHCWLVEVASAKSNAVSEAIWLIDIATSLLNLTMFHLMGAHAPRLGKCDAHPLRSDSKDFSVVLEKNLVSSGFSESIGHYVLGKDALKFCKGSQFCKTVNEIFYPAEKSIAERLARGLGWLSRARRSNDKDERFLLFFTAIESMLSSADKDVTVIQNISRFLGCIMTDDHTQRHKWAGKMKSLYGSRSKLVHNGVRGISISDMKTIENIAELLFLQIIDRVEIRDNFEVFVGNLNRVSYGLPWIDGRDGWLERARV